ncbi:hypothetical protein LTR56_012337 [Elasticomyces elasticus]|nr:hypothetical protein LTR56_012337 [Elasticomyces elasticus]KAK3641293.1 hypothetical protein LTR22_016661 [Elasticomyces elasticus]KAK4922622.1 hypothetical protein LTR49_010149 [Elasticomyces elasticus]KAK5760795.1 hypothetical protein LTS12_009153 [Elasticomyces elasticus]
MAPFATAARPRDYRTGFDFKSLHAITKRMASIGETMVKLNVTAVEETISDIKDNLEKLAPFICEGKVSPSTADCEKAAMQHAHRLRKMIEAFKITIESNSGLWEANDQSRTGDKVETVSLNFRKVSLERQKELEAQQLEAYEVAMNLAAEMYANAPEQLKACPFADVEDAKERCSKAMPLTKDEFIMKLAIAIIACPIFHATMVESAVTSSSSSDVPSYHEILESRKLDVVAMQQKSHQLAHAMKYYEQHLSAAKKAGNFECAQAREKTHDRHTLLDKFTQECIEIDQKFILVFENALAAPGKNFSSLVASWDSERVHVRQPGSKLLGEFTAAFVKQLELCDGLSIVVQESKNGGNVVKGETRSHEEL